MAKQGRRIFGRSGSRRSSGGGIRRALGILALVPFANRAPAYTRLVWALVRDERTPAASKAILGGALGYLVLGRDLIPDSIPIVGGLDDLVVVALAVDVFIDGVDDVVLSEHLAALDIDRTAFEEDLAKVRKILPGPVRRTARRLPQLIQQAAGALQRADLGPRLRAWINREESIA